MAACVKVGETLKVCAELQVTEALWVAARVVAKDPAVVVIAPVRAGNCAAGR